MFRLSQDERKLKDFNIEKEAQGVDRVAKEEYTGVVVKDGILEIRFHYSGKGSTAVPTRGTYGPLISAISVVSGNSYSTFKFVCMSYPFRSRLLVLVCSCIFLRGLTCYIFKIFIAGKSMNCPIDCYVLA